MQFLAVVCNLCMNSSAEFQGFVLRIKTHHIHTVNVEVLYVVTVFIIYDLRLHKSSPSYQHI